MFLNCSSLDFAYQAGKNVLRGIDFSLEKSDTLAIVGASGCGKSTLLRIISGILANTKGNILNGRVSVDQLSPDEYRRTGKLAFMFQEATLMPNLTVRQNIGFPLKIKGVQENDQVEELLHTVGLAEYADYLPNQLSGGMKTRVSLARSFITQPELLLLDEPFSALDIAWKSKLYVELEKLRQRYQTTTIIVTHDVQEAILLSNKVIVLNRHGEIQPPEHQVISPMSLTERVNNISGFLQESQYQELFVIVQDTILKDGKRKSHTRQDALNLVNEMVQVAGNPEDEEQLGQGRLDAIRDYSNDAEINAGLLAAFAKAKTALLKYQLIWDILEYDGLTDQIHNDIFEYYLSHLPIFSEYSRQWFAAHSDEQFFEILKGRIESDKGFNKRKKWIYLCDMCAIKSPSMVSGFLDEVIAGNIPAVNFSLAQTVADKIKNKIENEKTGSIYNA
jgi:ABC-type nitrate/sulfonate/bicarbonate transport system ATPase subunit